jgi:electron transport complex protein RnfC
MRGKTFPVGGIHPPHFKEATEEKNVRPAQIPAKVVLPLQQHIGAPCEPLVAVGDLVKVGQKIADSKGFVSAPIHATISGKVVAIEPRPHPNGTNVPSIVIEGDGQDTVWEGIKPYADYNQLSVEELRNILRDAGLVGLGGATFPTHVKLSPPEDKKVETVILNGAECEPYLTADHRLMVEHPEDVVEGLKIFMRVLGVDKGYIGVENNKEDAIIALRNAVGNDSSIEVVSCEVKYPQGAEKQLIKAILDREVPSGGLPLDVGVVVNNVGTAAAAANLMKTGMPLIERIVTITGSGIKEPQNMMIRLGTMFSEVIEQCGGLNNNAAKIIMGGPMMGLAQNNVDIPVIKGTSGILVLTDKEAKVCAPQTCIRCAKCVDACPMALLPSVIGNYALKDMIDVAEEYCALDCIECGSCSYVCPAKLPLVHAIRYAKAEIAAKRRK